MWLKRKNAVAPMFAPLLLGLFAGRIISEQWAVQYGVSLAATIFLTAGLTLLAFFSLRHHPLNQTWPLLLLAAYLFYPQPNLLAAAVVLLAVTAVIAQTTPLPRQILPPDRTVKLGLLGTVIFFGGLYLLTAAPGLLPADSGEFQLVGATLGVAHPPGFPLYTILSRLMAWLPLAATAAYKINLLSVITSTATLALVYLTVYRLTERHLAAGTAVLALGTATTFWAQATTANIRSLTAFFAALAIYALIRHAQKKEQTDRYLVLFAAALSFGFTHHLSLAFMGLVFGLSLLLIDPALFRTPSRWKRPFLAALLGLIPLLYLPLRAGADVPGTTDGLNTVSGFLNHFLALGFQGDFFYFVQPVVLWPRLKVMGNSLTFQFSPWLLAGALLGWILLTRRHWRLGLLLGGAFALHTLITATYRAPQTVEYMMPAYVPLAVCIGAASGYLSRFSLKQPIAVRWIPLTVTAVLFTAAVWQGWDRWPSYRWLHHTEDARNYAETILADAPPGSLVLANWHWVTPLWYLQTVEGVRPDVTIEYIAPGEGPYSQTWADQIEAGLANGRSVIATFIDEAAYGELPPAEPLGEALLFRQTPRTEIPGQYTPLNLAFGDGRLVLGYTLEHTAVEIGQEVNLTLAWQGTTVAPFYVHLLDETGSIVGQADVQAVPQPEGITLTMFRLTPRQGPGDFTLRLGSGQDFSEIGMLTVRLASLPPASQNPVYRPSLDETRPWTLIGYDWDKTVGGNRIYLHWKTDGGYFSTTMDNPLAPVVRNLLAPWGLRQNSWLIPTPAKPQHYVPLGQGIVWVGPNLSDLSDLNSLTTFAPDMTVELPVYLINGRPLLRDYVVSTRLVGLEPDNFTWAWCDQVDSIPAMGGIPTLKWIHGSQVQSPRTIVFPPRTQPAKFNGYCQSEKPAPGAPFLFVDDAAQPGQTVSGMLRIYDAFTNRPLPILDERITAVYSWIPLGEAIIEE